MYCPSFPFWFLKSAMDDLFQGSVIYVLLNEIATLEKIFKNGFFLHMYAIQMLSTMIHTHCRF